MCEVCGKDAKGVGGYDADDEWHDVCGEPCFTVLWGPVVQ